MIKYKPKFRTKLFSLQGAVSKPVCVQMIKLIPTKVYFEIQTPLSYKEITERLRKNVGKWTGEYFGGKIHSDGFDIREAVVQNYFFLPVFHGKVDIKQSNALIHVRVSNMLASIGTLWVWAWALGFIFFGLRELRGESHMIENSLAAFGAGIFCAGLAVWFAWFYWRKVKDGKELLNTLLTVPEIEKQDA